MMSNASSDIHKEQKLRVFTMDLYDDEPLIKRLEKGQKRQQLLEAKRLAEEESLREKKEKANASSDLHKKQKLGEITMDLYDDEALIDELEREQKRQKRLEAKRLAEEESLRERKEKKNADSYIHKEQKLEVFITDLYDDEPLIKRLEKEQKRQKLLEAKRLAEEEYLREKKKANASSDLHKEQKLGEITMDLYDDEALIEEIKREQKRQKRLETKRLVEEESLRERKEKNNADSYTHKEQKLGVFITDLYDDEPLIKRLEKEQKRQKLLEAKRLAEEESLGEKKEKANASSDIHKEQKLGEITMDLYDDKALMRELVREQKRQQLLEREQKKQRRREEALIKELERERKRQERLEAKRLAEEEFLRERKEKTNASSDIHKEESAMDLYDDNALIRELERERKRQERLEAKRLAEEESLRERKEKALKGMKYLLGLSEQYTTFFHQKVFSNTVNTKPLQEKNKLQPTLRDLRDAAEIKNKKEVKGKSMNYFWICDQF